MTTTQSISPVMSVIDMKAAIEYTSSLHYAAWGDEYMLAARLIGIPGLRVAVQFTYTNGVRLAPVMWVVIFRLGHNKRLVLKDVGLMTVLKTFLGSVFVPRKSLSDRDRALILSVIWQAEDDVTYWL